MQLLDITAFFRALVCNNIPIIQPFDVGANFANFVVHYAIHLNNVELYRGNV